MVWSHYFLKAIALLYYPIVRFCYIWYGAAQCWGEVRSRSGYTSTLTVSLQQDGTTIKSWSVYGGGLRTVDESYTVEKGHSYQVIASVVVKDSKGTVVDRTSEESRVQSY